MSNGFDVEEQRPLHRILKGREEEREFFRFQSIYWPKTLQMFYKNV
jgi:hypothetical protein